MDSILDTVKDYMDISLEDTVFDNNLMIVINTAIMNLSQLGVGIASGFSVTSSAETWEELLGTDTTLEGAKNYICAKSKMLFDPPTNSFMVDAFNRVLTEQEWRLEHQVQMNKLEDV